jgi:hypothetical protein
MTEETTDRQEPFFAFDDEQDEQDGRARRSIAWKPTAVGLLGLLLGLVLAVSAALAWDDSRRLAGYADRSWVISGQYQDLTNDLQTKTWNPIYRGVLPADEAVTEQPFDSGLADPRVPEAGEEIVFRGTQTGSEAGEFGDGVTAGTIAWQRVQAALLLLAGLAAAGGGVWFARRLYRREH